MRTPPPSAGDMCGGVPCVEEGGGLAAGQSSNQNPSDSGSSNSNGNSDNSDTADSGKNDKDNGGGSNGDKSKTNLDEISDSSSGSSPGGADGPESDLSGTDDADHLSGGIVAVLVVIPLICVLLIVAGFVLKRRQSKGKGALPENKGLPPGWEAYIDKGSGVICYENTETGETSWERPPGSKPVVTNASKKPAIAMTSMENPMRKDHISGARPHARTVTELPHGWIKDFDHTQNAEYYFNEVTSEMSWDPPPGTTSQSSASCKFFQCTCTDRDTTSKRLDKGF